MRFIKPLDEQFINKLCDRMKCIITVEDGCLKGGFGSAVLETLNKLELENIKTKRLGLPDEFILQGKREQLLSDHIFYAN